MEARVLNFENTNSVKKALRDHAAYYPYRVKEDLFEAYAKKLGFYDASVVETALEQISEGAGRSFPTIADIKSICKMYEPPRKYKIDQEYDDMLKAENEIYEQVRKFVDGFAKTEDERKLMDRYFKYYFREMFGEKNYTEIKHYGLSLETFKKCAYFDLYESKMNIAKAIELLHKKKEEAKDERKEVNFRSQGRKIYYWH